MSQRVTGRCLCERIRYEISGEFGPVMNCHCSKCRRWHGAVFRTRALIRKHQFRWTAGEQYLSRYDSSEHVTKFFCRVCGSNLISTYRNRPDFIGLPMGGLEQDPGVQPQANIFVAYKAPWYRICDGRPCHDEWLPGMGTAED